MQTYLSTAETAEMIGISSQSLNKLRRAGTGPKAVRINARVFRFGREDVDHWLRQNAQPHAHSPDHHDSGVEAVVSIGATLTKCSRRDDRSV